MSLDQMYIPYLHFALDLLLEKKLNENYRQIKEMKNLDETEYKKQKFEYLNSADGKLILYCLREKK